VFIAEGKRFKFEDLKALVNKLVHLTWLCGTDAFRKFKLGLHYNKRPNAIISKFPSSAELPYVKII